MAVSKQISRFLPSSIIQALLLMILVIEWYCSLSWRQVHDSPILNYVAFLIHEQGKLPYKDIFETSMPGTIGFHLLITKIFGYSDLGFRCADMLFFALLSIVTFKILQFWDKRTALLGSIFFGLYYLWEGHSMSLERDYLSILPLACCFLSVMSGKNYLFSGICWAVAFWIKPHTVLAGSICLIFLFFSNKKQLKTYVLYNCLGFIIVSTIIVFILWQADILNDWWKITTEFLPKHIRMAHNLEVLDSKERIPYLWRGLRTFGQQGKWLLPLLTSFICHIFFLKKNDPTRKYILLITGCVVFFWLYTAISGQFWKYHWMPFKYCLILGATTLFSERVWKSTVGMAVSSILTRDMIYCLFLILFSYKYVQPIPQWPSYIHGERMVSEKNLLADELTKIIMNHTNESDKVQVVDWTEGSIQALLQSKRTLATSFLYDYMFYLDVKSPYTQQLRKRFLQELRDVNPVLIIEMKHRVRVSGKYTGTSFPEWDKWIAENYVKIIDTEDYFIFQKNR